MDLLNVCEYNLICRLCLKKGHKLNRLISLNECVDIIKKIHEITTIEINLNDNFPNHICTKCNKQLDQSFDFRSNSLKSDNLIRLHYLVHADDIEDDVDNLEDNLKNDNSLNEIVNDNNENLIEIINEKSEESIFSILPIKRKPGRPRKSSTSIKLGSPNQSIQELYNDNESKRKSLRVKKANPKFVEDKNFSEDDDDDDDDDEYITDDLIKNEYTNSEFDFQDKNIKKEEDLIDTSGLSPKSLSEYLRKTKTIPKSSRKFILDPTLKKPKYYYSITTVCTICKTVLPRKDMKYHMNEHNRYFPFKCEICNKMFSSPLKKSKHKIFVHSTKLIPCDLCELTFKSINNLKRHKKGVHLKMYTCECDICHTKFTTREAHKRHLLIHTNEKNYECNECGKFFRTKFNLNTHLRVHTKIKPFKCEICDAVFGYNLALKKHVQKQHLEELNPRRFSFECQT